MAAVNGFVSVAPFERRCDIGFAGAGDGFADDGVAGMSFDGSSVGGVGARA